MHRQDVRITWLRIATRDDERQLLLLSTRRVRTRSSDQVLAIEECSLVATVTSGGRRSRLSILYAYIYPITEVAVVTCLVATKSLINRYKINEEAIYYLFMFNTPKVFYFLFMHDLRIVYLSFCFSLSYTLRLYNGFWKECGQTQTNFS